MYIYIYIYIYINTYIYIYKPGQRIYFRQVRFDFAEHHFRKLQIYI